MVKKELYFDYEQNHSKIHITVSDDTHALILTSLKEEFLKHHPEMEGLYLPKGFLVRRAIKYYLQQ